MRRFFRRHRRSLVGLAFISPWIVGFVLFTAYPLITSIVYSFHKVTIPLDGIRMEPIGIQNYTDVLMNNADFKKALPDYLMKLCCYVPMVLVFSCMLALLLDSPIRMRKLVRAIFFLPVIISSGPVLSNLKELGASTLVGLDRFPVYVFIGRNLPDFIAQPILYVFDNALQILWLCGVPTLIFLSGLQKRNPAVYEAAMVDGASAWQSFWKLTIPSLRSFFFLNGIYSVVEISMRSDNQIITLIKTKMDASGFGYGFSSAVAMIYFILILLAVLIQFLLFGMEKKEKAAVEIWRRR